MTNQPAESAGAGRNAFSNAWIAVSGRYEQCSVCRWKRGLCTMSPRSCDTSVKLLDENTHAPLVYVAFAPKSGTPVSLVPASHVQVSLVQVSLVVYSP